MRSEKGLVNLKRLESELRRNPKWLAVLACLPRHGQDHVRLEDVAIDVRSRDNLPCTEAEVRAITADLQRIGLNVHCSASRGLMHWYWHPREYAVVENLFREMLR